MPPLSAETAGKRAAGRQIPERLKHPSLLHGVRKLPVNCSKDIIPSQEPLSMPRCTRFSGTFGSRSGCLFQHPRADPPAKERGMPAPESPHSRRCTVLPPARPAGSAELPEAPGQTYSGTGSPLHGRGLQNGIKIRRSTECRPSRSRSSSFPIYSG